MSSLIQGYEYDIFISYRQKDNEYDGWVTEFVDNLKRELHATFKEDKSIYFDINPQDGLLETHIVDESLAKKLKCLIFIPIISQTYCDLKSFAWQQEFVAFNKLAKEDQFGRDIRLVSGNAASRILPIKINDLDTEDKTLLENEIGGMLRCIEFIYKAAGVNRPLRANEDHPQDNLNKTYYRDQINKVANAVKEIITAIKKHNQQDGEVLKEIVTAIPKPQQNLKTKIIIASIIILALIVLGYFLIPTLSKPKEQLEKSIAVLPFKSLSDDPAQQYLADGTMDAILLHLQKFSDLRVLSRTSVEQYRGTKKTTHAIGQELGVAYLLEGSFQKSGNNIRLIVQLIKASKKEDHAWANEYDRNWTDIFSVQSEVAQTIAGELHTIITPSEKELIKKVPTANLAAYDLYLKANGYQKDYQKTRNLSSYQNAVIFYKAALEIDSAFAKAYAGLASAYWSRYYNETYFKQNFMDSCLVLVNKALSIDYQLDEAYYLKGQYYQMANGHIEVALDNYDKALRINPNYSDAYLAKGFILTYIKHDYVKGIENDNKALNLIRGDERPYLLRVANRGYLDVGFIEKAKHYDQEAFALDSNKAQNFYNLAWLEFNNENFEPALKLEKKGEELDSTYINEDLTVYNVCPSHNEEAYVIAKKEIENYKKSGELSLLQSYRIGYAFWQVGKKKEAEYYFNQQIKYDEESIKLGRDIEQWKAAYYDIAATYAFLGDKVRAYKYLDEFNTMNFYPLWWIILAKHDRLFASISNEERFQKILQNMEAKYLAEHERVRKWLEEQGML
jgi:TolB-like protein